MNEGLYWWTGTSLSVDFFLRTLVPPALFDRATNPDAELLVALRGVAARGGKPSAVLGREEDPTLLAPMALVLAATAEERLLRREGF